MPHGITTTLLAFAAICLPVVPAAAPALAFLALLWECFTFYSMGAS